MFAGTYQHTLDPKNRIVIPSSLRSVIPQGPDARNFFVSPWQLGDIRCVSVFTQFAWQEMVNRLDARANVDETAEKYLTMISAAARPVGADPEWRIVLPDTLIASAQLGREVVLVGRRWQILVMAPDPWTRFSEQLDRDYPEVYKQVLRVPSSEFERKSTGSQQI
jgi:MraZ protein